MDAEVTPSDASPRALALHARVIATGLPGAHGIRQVGRFHRGGPITNDPEFLLQTEPGRVLDPERVLIAIESNLGAPLGNRAHAAGSVLSIDPRAATAGRPIVVPANRGLFPQRTDGDALQIYTAQTADAMNRVHNSSARTARFTASAGPRYLSMNNGFGRPWIANAPFGLLGDGSESVVDPDGKPLEHAPDDAAGGVFVGAATQRESVAKKVRSGLFASVGNRTPSVQLTPGAIRKGALGTALLGTSPDGSGFAVFAIVTGEGAVVQAHVQDGLDGLAPAGTIAVGDADPGLIGIVFNWIPQRALYVADALRDRLVVLHLSDDTRQFTVARSSSIVSPWLRQPVDLAAAIPEIANARFASHTTLAGGADLYVVNRGDGSLLRVGQDGTVRARAVIDIAGEGRLGAGRLRSIAVSADAQRVWLIAQRVGSDESMLIEVDGFDAAGSFASSAPAATAAARESLAVTELVAQGARAFRTVFTPATGLAPLFDANSCVVCHPGPGGASAQEEHFVQRVTRMDPSSGRVMSIYGQQNIVAPRLSAPSMGQTGAQAADLPRGANVVSLRMPRPLFAIRGLDDIPDAVIEAQAVSKGDGIKGRANVVTAADGARRVGRYGNKADIANLDEQVGRSFRNMGLPIKNDDSLVRAVSAYLRTLAPPAETAK